MALGLALVPVMQIQNIKSILGVVDTKLCTSMGGTYVFAKSCNFAEVDGGEPEVGPEKFLDKTVFEGVLSFGLPPWLVI